MKFSLIFNRLFNIYVTLMYNFSENICKFTITKRKNSSENNVKKIIGDVYVFHFVSQKHFFLQRHKFK